MKIKYILLTAILCIVCFLSGIAGDRLYLKKPVKDGSSVVKIDSLQNGIKSNLNEKKSPSEGNTEDVDFSKMLKGKFILKGSDYAGFEFIDTKNISWTNEMFPMDPDSMRLKWIDKHTFVATFRKSSGNDCPPSNWIRKVEYYDGNKLILRNFWTGWNDLKDESETFFKE